MSFGAWFNEKRRYFASLLMNETMSDVLIPPLAQKQRHAKDGTPKFVEVKTDSFCRNVQMRVRMLLMNGTGGRIKKLATALPSSRSAPAYLPCASPGSWHSAWPVRSRGHA